MRKSHHIGNQRSTERPAILDDCGETSNKVLDKNAKTSPAFAAADYYSICMTDGNVADIQNATASTEC